MKRSAFLWTLGILAAGCGVSDELYNARVTDLNRTRAETEKAQGDLATCQKATSTMAAQNTAMRESLEAAGQDVSRLGAERGYLEKVLAEARRREEEMRKKQEQMEKRAATYQELVAKLKGMIDAGQLQVETRDGRMLVKLPDNILFDPGKTQLKPAGVTALKQLGAVLGQIADRKFQVAGHTDNVPIKSGKFKSNWDLSAARAVEVVRILSASGLDQKRLSAAGYADNAPIADNLLAEGRSRNRRIEIVLQPNIEELPPTE
ncbi:MAG: OmpA family protein [Myxococcota bacterium]